MAPLFWTSALGAGEWLASYPWLLGQDAGWAPDLVWTLRNGEKSLFFVGKQMLAIQPILPMIPLNIILPPIPKSQN
jgi:hypothetical protein